MIEIISDPKKVKSRKNHRCNFCNENIIKDIHYISSTLSHEGDIYTWKSHLHCDWLVKELDMYSDCPEGVTSEDFISIISDKYNDILQDNFPEIFKNERYSDIRLALFHTSSHHKLRYTLKHLKNDK